MSTNIIPTINMRNDNPQGAACVYEVFASVSPANPEELSKVGAASRTLFRRYYAASRTLFRRYYEAAKTGINMDAPSGFAWLDVDEVHTCVRGKMILTPDMFDHFMRYITSAVHTDMVLALRAENPTLLLCPLWLTELTDRNTREVSSHKEQLSGAVRSLQPQQGHIATPPQS